VKFASLDSERFGFVTERVAMIENFEHMFGRQAMRFCASLSEGSRFIVSSSAAAIPRKH
jgi:hypothetical protein